MNADSAFDLLAGSASRLIDAATSFAVIGVPSLNVTPWRILNVHSLASGFDVHDSASHGVSCLFSSTQRNSPVRASMARPPVSPFRTGSTSVVGVVMPRRMVAARGAAPRPTSRRRRRCCPRAAVVVARVVRAAARGDQERDHRQRETRDRAPLDELPPVDPTGDVLIDDVVLDVVPAAPENPCSALKVAHALPSSVSPPSPADPQAKGHPSDRPEPGLSHATHAVSSITAMDGTLVPAMEQSTASRTSLTFTR